MTSTGPIALDGTFPFIFNATGGTVKVTPTNNSEPATIKPLAGKTLDGQGCALRTNPVAAGELRLSCPAVLLTRRIEDEKATVELAVTGVLNAVGNVMGARVMWEMR